MNILCVDDDVNVLEGYRRSLRKQYNLHIATGGEAGLRLIESQGPYAVVVADMGMPGMDGVEFLNRVRERAPDTVRCMLTGNGDQATAVKAVNEGKVFQFLTKPCSAEAFAQALRNGVAQYRLVMAERELLEMTLNGSVHVMSEVLALADPHAFGLGQRLRECMRAFARSCPGAQAWELELAAMLSQLGFVTVPAAVLEKHRAGSNLSGPQADMIRRAPETGANLIAHIPRLEQVAQIVRYQQKNYDGSGFPADSVKASEIPAGARILRVLRDMLTLESRGFSRFKALTQMQTVGGRYDPTVLKAAFVHFDIYLPDDESDGGPEEAVGFADLRLGDVLAGPIETTEKLVIAGSGTEVTATVMQKLRNFREVTRLCEPIRIRARHAPAAGAGAETMPRETHPGIAPAAAIHLTQKPAAAAPDDQDMVEV
jgi:response regulator RpfG family c-di-GMP phosphodiesterase